MGAFTSHQPGAYKEPELPDGVMEVRISVYKLPVTGYSIVDDFGASMLGAFHSACVVGGWEFAFGGHDMKDRTGVYKGKPEKDANYNFYKRVVMGHRRLSTQELKDLILTMVADWPGTGYDIVERNCNHFCSDLCWALLRKRPPAWINATADELLLERQKIKAIKDSLHQARAAYRAEHKTSKGAAPTTASQIGQKQVPGERAFVDAFKSTFEAAFKIGRARGEKLLNTCPKDQDPLQFKNDVIRDVLNSSGRAAAVAASAVATAARAAGVARSQYPEESAALQAWDEAWIAESGALLRTWREAAVADTLPAEDVRDALVQAALAAAAEAAAVAEAGGVSGAKVAIASGAADADGCHDAERSSVPVFTGGDVPSEEADEEEDVAVGKP